MPQGSQEFFAQACSLIPGGVNSPVRAFKSVGIEPTLLRPREGQPRLGRRRQRVRRLRRVVGSDDPRPRVRACPRRGARAAATRARATARRRCIEVTMAEAVARAVPEHRDGALRLQRHRGDDERDPPRPRLHRPRQVHQVRRQLPRPLRRAARRRGLGPASRSASRRRPASRRAPRPTPIVLPYNDLDAVAEALEARGRADRRDHRRADRRQHGRRPAASPASCRVCATCATSTASCSSSTRSSRGFRVALGGAQELYGVTPDLTTLGKIIGGGFPVGAFGGKREIMEQLAPVGPVYQAGTLSGNPVAMVAGLATIDAALAARASTRSSSARASKLADGLCRAAGSAAVHDVLQPRRLDVDDVLHRPRGLELGDRLDARHRALRRATSAGCSTRASCSRRASSRRASCRSRTPTRRSTRSYRQPARCSRRSRVVDGIDSTEPRRDNPRYSS